MKKITFLLLLFTFLTQVCIAQRASAGKGNLTFYSVDGSKFYLELNGVRYNERAQESVRIEELPNTLLYNCKIIFEDSRNSYLEKKKITIADANGKPQDVTFRIIKTRRGARTLSLYSIVPIQPNMQRPENYTTYCHDNPRQIIAGPGYSAPPVRGQNGNASYPGVRGGSPSNGTTVTTTTTTTTTTNGSNYGYPNQGGNGYPNNSYNEPIRHQDGGDNYGNIPGACRYAMPAADFEQAKATVKDNSFDDTKLSTAQEIISSNCISAAQVLELVKLFNFEATKLKLAKFAYANCIDKNNYFKVSNAFSFEHSKTELNDYIRQQR
jgi:hypothetical protein